jgi:serine/threonine protein kinase
MKDYELIEQIAKGDFGELWKARHISSGDLVAVKIIPIQESLVSASLDQIMEHWKALIEVQHKNIASIQENFLAQNDCLYIIMEYVQGSSLKQLIRDRITFPLSQWVDIFLQCAYGLRAAYRRNIIHRDIKPSNIMMTKQGIVKIVDFGLARFFRYDSSLQQEGPHPMPYPSCEHGPESETIVGTPRFMSPEQCMGKALDHRSDIYSLGATFYYCLAGKPPFEAETCAEILQKQKITTPIPLYALNPNIPLEISELIQKMLEKDPSDRFQDYDILIETLESIKLACLSHERGSALKPPSPDRITVHEKHPLSPVRMDKKSEEGFGKRNLIIILLAFVLILASLVFILYRKEERMAGGNRRVIENLLNRFLLDSSDKSKPTTIPNDTETTPRLRQQETNWGQTPT